MRGWNSRALPSFVAWAAIGVGFVMNVMAIEVTVIQPPAGGLVSGAVNVTVTVTSPFEVRGVVAELPEQVVDLVFEGGRWNGVIALDELEKGELSLRVTATDFFGTVGDTELTVIHDSPPVLRVIEPTSATVAAPSIRVVLDCEDDEPGCQVSLIKLPPADIGARTVLLEPTEAPVDREFLDELGLSTIYVLEARAIDSRGQVTVRNLGRFFRQADPRFKTLLRVDGPILDFDEDRIANVSSADGRERAVVRRRENGEEIASVDLRGSKNSFVRLTARGVIVGLPESGQILELRDGMAISHGNGGWLGAGSSTAVWWDQRDLTALNTSTGEKTGPTDSIHSPGEVDVAANGDVVWASPGGLFRYRNGGIEQLDSEGRRPITDGTAVVYTRSDGLARFASGVELLYSGSLADLGAYLPAGGWVAYERRGSERQFQVWRAAPGTPSEQITFFNRDSRLVTINPNGDVFWNNFGWYHVTFPDQRPDEYVQISRWTIGGLIWEKDRWLSFIGDTLFEVDMSVAELAIAVEGDGWVKVDPERRNYYPGTKLTFTAIPFDGRSFIRWEGDVDGKENPLVHAVEARTSLTAVFGLLGKPQFLSHPSSASPVVGDRLEFIAVAESGSTLTYQWFKDGIEIQGAETDSLVIVNAGLADAGEYWLEATNEAGTTRSWSAVVGLLFRVDTFIAGGRGSMVLDPAGGLYPPGTSVRVSVIPEPGYAFAGWEGAEFGSDVPLRFLIDENLMIGARFVPADREVAIELGDSPFGDGRFGFSVIGEGGVPHVIEVSGDLNHWVPIEIFEMSNEPFAYVDPTAQLLAVRFYRVRRLD